MSSCLRSSDIARTLPAAPGFVAASFSSGGLEQPFPWRFNKRTQQIDLEFVDGFNNSTSISDRSFFFRGQQFGALHLVLGLGPNFINWCETELTADAGTVTMLEKPIVVNANLVARGQDPNNGESNESTSYFSFEEGSGSSAGKYCKTLVFMKPLVIKYERSGTTYYRWFSNNFEGNT